MPRTTINIDAPVLEELKAIRKEEGVPLGTLASSLLAEAISRRKEQHPPAALDWKTRRMGARVDLADKDALHQVLEEGG